MRARYVILCGAAVLIHTTAWSEEISADFRRSAFDNAALKLTGECADQLVKPTERGLAVRIPPNEGIVGPIGLAPRKLIHGDFEIIAEFELLRFQRPRESSGVGVGLVVDFPAAGTGAIAISRLATPSGGDQFISADLPFGDGSAPRYSRTTPARSRAGKLKLVRTASTVRAYYADGNDTFKLLREVEVGDADARIVRLGVETGSRPYRVEALFAFLTVTAEALVEPAEPPPPSPPGVDPLFLTITSVDIVFFGLVAWKLWRPRSRKTARKGA